MKGCAHLNTCPLWDGRRGGGVTHLLLALVIRLLTTDPLRGGAGEAYKDAVIN